MAASHTRTWVAPNLYQRGDGRFVAGFSIDGCWRMRTLQAASMREALLELAHLRSAAAAPPEAEPVLVEQAIEEFLARFGAQVASGERSPRTLDKQLPLGAHRLRPSRLGRARDRTPYPRRRRLPLAGAA